MRILIIDPYMPLFDCASGYRRLVEILRILVSRGDAVSFVACEGRNQERYAAALRVMGIEVYAGNPDASTEEGHLVMDTAQGGSTDLARLVQFGRYDLVIFSYYHTAEAYLSVVRRLSPITRVMIDTIDVHCVREQREAELYNDAELFQQAAEVKRRELAIYSQVDAVITVTHDDRRFLLEVLPGARIHVIPNIHVVAEYVPLWEKRVGLLFVGNFHHRPNRDAARFLCQEIMPRVWNSLPNVSLTIAGFAVPVEIQAFAEERITIVGHVPDMTPYLQSHRISLAPLRFGAGLKGKIGEALAAGTPVITTPIGAEGMPLFENPDALLIAEDSEAFAEAIGRLYQDESVWHVLSARGRDLVLKHYSPQVVAKLVDGVLSEYETAQGHALTC
jgi:glycosyltransferase involved in cell wall biosynthesis